jgi:hypothetical protein
VLERLFGESGVCGGGRERLLSRDHCVVPPESTVSGILLRAGVLGTSEGRVIRARSNRSKAMHPVRKAGACAGGDSGSQE